MAITSSETRERRIVGFYWAAIGVVLAVKAILVADLPLEIVFSPHDDSLYVLRAFHLLNGEAFGPYDSRTLVKLPGISLWLATTRLLGVPYLLAVNTVYAAAGIYLLHGLRAVGVGRALLVFGFLLYMFNPLTWGQEWGRVLREPLSTGMQIATFAAMLHLLLALEERSGFWPHLGFLSVLFPFALLLREEDKLLWGLVALFLLSAVWTILSMDKERRRWRLLLPMVTVPFMVAIFGNYVARDFVQDHYGLPMLHDMSEGEFPRLIAAIRGIESQTDNRMVMVSQEKLRQLRALIPELAPIIDRIPPPGPNTSSCRLQGVCSEWNSGYMMFWIKDGAGAAGRTPDLQTAQRFFKTIREKIENLCAQEKLVCHPRGSGLFPPMELRWTRAFVSEFGRILRMTIYPNPHTVVEPPSLYNVPLTLGRTYQSVVMTSGFDSLAQTSVSEGNDRPIYRNILADLRQPAAAAMRIVGAIIIVAGTLALLWRWLMYPSVSFSPIFYIGTVYWVYSFVRLLALGYIAVYLGPYEPRIVFSTYTGALLLSCFLIWDCRQAWQYHHSMGH